MNKQPYDQQFLADLEYELEVLAVEEGIKRYNEWRAESDPASMTPEKLYIMEGMEAMVPVIQEIQDTLLSPEAKPQLPQWAVPFLSLDPEQLALITLIRLFNSAIGSADTSFAQLCLDIASGVQTERLNATIRGNHKDVYKQLCRRVKNITPSALKWAARNADIANDQWPKPVSLALGSQLAAIAIERTTFFIYEKRYIKGRTATVVALDPLLREDIEKQHEDLAILRPFLLPMVVPPMPGGLVEGRIGYLYSALGPIKNSYATKMDLSRQPDMSMVYEAVNILQDVPWQVNQFTFNVARALWQLGGGFGAMPTADPKPLPEAPPSWDDPDLKTEWKRQAAAVHTYNAQTAGQRKSVAAKLWIANKFKDYTFYFPHQMDWRGRVYPAPVELHPQSDDLARGMLQFANAKPLGKDGLRWLRIHIANCWGYDKLSLGEREQVVILGANELESYVRDPLINRGWLDAEDPFQLLAAAKEYVEACATGEPERFPSRTPIGIDGTCNGLQHYAAIGRDCKGAASTSLQPAERPGDIYTAVAGTVASIASEQIDRVSGEDLAVRKAVQRVLCRKLVKRAVMTTPYGLSAYGMKFQFLEDGMLDELEGKMQVKVADWLREAVTEAIATEVQSASEWMEWLRKVADIASDLGKPLTWTTPDGLVVSQDYCRQTTRRVTTVLGEITYKVDPKEHKINKRKQSNSIAPNFIHSLDATHMRAVLVDCTWNRGILDFAMIHDSFATHACDVSALRDSTRELFVTIHESDPMLEAKEQWEQQLGVTLPDPPERGTFDLQRVLESEYFFC